MVSRLKLSFELMHVIFLLHQSQQSTWQTLKIRGFWVLWRGKLDYHSFLWDKAGFLDCPSAKFNYIDVFLTESLYSYLSLSKYCYQPYLIFSQQDCWECLIFILIEILSQNKLKYKFNHLECEYIAFFSIFYINPPILF